MSAAALRIALVFVLAGCAHDPPTSDAAGLAHRDVRILRDSWGVPHVFGRTDPDVAFGLAYAHAEDDFRTISFSVRAARGRLAAKIGLRGAANDYLVALLGVWETVEHAYERELSPETRALVEAYADGLNLYAARHPRQIDPDLLPFTGRDVVAGFVHKLPLFLGLDRVLRRLLEAGGSGYADPAPGAAGSNALAVAPRRSADGRTRLAVNSHQPWTGPVAWYEVHLRSEQGWDMVGGLFPGAPVVLHGHNRGLGWASTVNRPDLIDVYRLEIDPERPERYRFDGQWRELERRTLAIRVRVLGPFSWTVRREVLRSVHGPVLRTPDGTYAIRYAGAGELRHIEQWYRMNKARSFDEWNGAMALGAIPMFNFVYADRTGRVAYVYNARLPLRAEGYDWRGVVPGDRSETLWTRTLPFDALPRVEDPPSGFVQSCNSSPFQTTLGAGNPDPRRYPQRFGIETRMTNRALRALELLGADASIGREEFLTIKYDMRYSERSRAAGWVRELLALELPEDPVVRRAREVLARWDLGTEPGNRGAAIGVLTLAPRFQALQDGEALPDLRTTFVERAHLLQRSHGRIDVAWSRVNRLVRGRLELGLGGGPDVLHAVQGDLVDGRVVGRQGDSYVLVAEWGREGVRSWSVHVHGSATLDETSPHYADQAPLFVARQLKPVWIDEVEIRAHLEREYRPGQVP